MKPFNLEEAKAGRPVCTRDGKPARIICWDKKGDYPIVALVMNEDKISERAVVFTLSGSYSTITERNSLDLMMAPEKKEGWVNLYKKNNEISVGGAVYDSKNDAESMGSPNDYYLATAMRIIRPVRL